MRNIFGIVFGLWCLVAPFVVHAGEKLTILAIDYPPYQSRDFPFEGLSGELLTNIFSNVGLEFEFEYFPLKRALTYLLKGKEHLFVGNEYFFSEEERKDFVIKPFINIRMTFFYYKEHHKEEINFKNLKDLKGYKIGVLRGGFETSSLLKEGLDIHETDTVKSLFEMLKRKRIDLVTMLDVAGIETIRKLYPGDENKFAFTRNHLRIVPGGLIISKKFHGYQEFEKKYDEGFKAIKDNGAYLKILEKYYGKGNVPVEVIID